MSSISVSCCHLNSTLFLWEKSFRPDALLHVMRPTIQAIKKSCSWMSPLGDINQTVHERTYCICPPTCIIRQEIEKIPPWLMCPSGFGWHFPSALKIQTQIRLLIKSIMWKRKVIVPTATPTLSCCHLRNQSRWEQSCSSVRHHSVLFHPLSGAESSGPPAGAAPTLARKRGDNWPSIHFSHWAKRRRVTQPATCGALWSTLSSNKS